jgi:hypothetical protein
LKTNTPEFFGTEYSFFAAGDNEASGQNRGGENVHNLRMHDLLSKLHRQSFLGIRKIERGAVHAVPKFGFGRTIVEYMA